MDDEQIELGNCCACGGSHDVRNLIMLDLKAPQPGEGCWGCLQCGLPQAGAIAVLCDRCVRLKMRARYVCVGYAELNQRAPIEECTEPFTHDMTKHPECWEESYAAEEDDY